MVINYTSLGLDFIRTVVMTSKLSTNVKKFPDSHSPPYLLI